MKVLLVNGSPRVGGNCDHLLEEMKKTYEDLGVEAEEIRVGGLDLRGCSACGYCATHEGCVFDDYLRHVAPKFVEADGIVLVSPVYFASPNGTLISFLDRLFHGYHINWKYKVGAAFAVARRGGTTASFDVLNKYFTIAGMPVAPGDYWNNAFGGGKGEVDQDEEGIRNGRIVAKRMVFLMKAIADGKEKYPELLEEERRVSTNFIR